MAHIPQQLEWPKLTKESLLFVTSRFSYPDRHFWNLGVWRILSWVLVATAVATKLDSGAYHGKRTCPYPFQLCDMSSPPDKTVSAGTMRQPQPCGSLSKRLIQGGQSNEITQMPVVLCSFYDIELQATHIAGSLNCTADHVLRNNIESFFSLHPQVFLLPVPLPIIAADGGLMRAELDIPLLYRSVQRYCSLGSAPSTWKA